MLKIYNIPEGEAVSGLYDIEINGLRTFAHFARVSAVPYNTIWPGYQRPLDQTEEAPFVCFRTDGECVFSVAPAKALRQLWGEKFPENVVVRPLSRKISCEIVGETVRFTLPGPGYYTLEFDGQHNCLHIFADGPETEKYEGEAEKATYRFVNGVFDAGRIMLKTGESVFIGEDAVVYGSICSENAQNIRVFGCGILDNSKEKRLGSSCCNLDIPNSDPGRVGEMQFYGCKNVAVEGIVFRDSACWTAKPELCDNVSFDRIKMIGMWRYNSDGIDFVNSKNGVVTNSFLRNFDDVVVLKGLDHCDTRNIENIYVSGCVLWCDWGRPLEFGAETCADEYRNIIFEDCDLIHNDCILMDIQSGDRAEIHDVIFRNIRCEYTRYQMEPVYQHDMNAPYKPSGRLFVPVLFNSNLYCGRWSDKMLLGNVHDIHVEDITIFADGEIEKFPVRLKGANPEHRNRNIFFKNIIVNGRKADREMLDITKTEFDEEPVFID